MTSRDILHLSDLHIVDRDQIESLAVSLEADLQHDLACKSLGAIVVSGDVTNFATEQEYAFAGEFLDGLCARFGVPKECLIVAPGNHDVSWDAAKLAMERVDKQPAAEPYFQDPNSTGHWFQVDADKYKSRFLNFSNFYQKACGSAFSLSYEEQFSVHVFKETGLLFLTLNSAWNLNHLYSSDADVHASCFNRALRHVMRIPGYEKLHKIAVWHHPVNGDANDRLRKHGLVERLAQIGFKLVLHGHTHASSLYRVFRDDTNNSNPLHVVGGGSLGAPTSELPTGRPWSYNLIRWDADLAQAVVIGRSRTSSHEPWRPHATWRKGPTDSVSALTIPFSTGVEDPIAIRNLAQLKEYCSSNNLSLDGHRVAVECHIFNEEGKVLLQLRGEGARDEIGRYEGIGGHLGLRKNLIEAAMEEIAQKLGTDVVVVIERLLDVRPVTFVERIDDRQPWYIVSYLCRLQSGEPKVMRPTITKALRYFALSEIEQIDDGELSRSTVQAFNVYRSKYGNEPYFDQ